MATQNSQEETKKKPSPEYWLHDVDHILDDFDVRLEQGLDNETVKKRR